MATAILAMVSFGCAAKDMSDAELRAIKGAWQRRCADFAAGEGRPELEKTCFTGFLKGVKEVDELRVDDTISEQMWDTCKIESGFNYTNDFHAWAACMRIARTRPGLRDY
ncbi:hypothetical protein ACSI5F_03795 [Ralstonia pseudosolanacearum]|uniref:hypothetical protein n=1 Tax=Ralstonia pseudosolanacearum TaxID=1310165 RepID=UPI003EE38B17